MRTRIAPLVVAVAVTTSLVGGLNSGSVSAAVDQPPVVGSGSMTVHYEDDYTIHFTASDPEGAPLTVVTQPVNEDWIGCDGGPVTDFTCDYSSSRYYDPAPLPTEPFQRTVSYSVSDGTTTSTGIWTVTVLPPPTMELTGRPTVTEGGEAVLQFRLSSNPFGSQIVQAHALAIDTADGEVIAQSTFMIEVADGQTAVEVRIPVDDDAIDEPTEFFSVSIEAADAIPYRFVAGGNLVTVLDNDGVASTDITPPTVATHRNVVVERSGSRPAWVFFSPPPATDDVDGALTSICNPGPMSAMPKGRSQVSCSATDSAGNTGSGTFQMTVRKPTEDGSARALGGHGDSQCVAPNEYAWVTAAGFTPGTRLTIQLQSSSLEVVHLQTVEADRKGRVVRLVKIPAVAGGDADVVISGRAGDDDLVRMLPLKVARGHHYHGGPLMALLRNKRCD
jgi:hypothetical protein